MTFQIDRLRRFLRWKLRSLNGVLLPLGEWKLLKKTQSDMWEPNEVKCKPFTYLLIQSLSHSVTHLLNCLLTYSSLFRVEHSSSTRKRHLTLFCAVPFTSFHVGYFLSNSAIHVRRQVCWGLPLFRFPCGFHSSALLTTCPSDYMSKPKLVSHLLLTNDIDHN